MKRYILIAVIFISCSLLEGCISLKPDSPLPTEPRVELIQLCKKIEDSGDLLKPSDIQSDFTLKDGHIFCFIELKDITKKIHLRWKWYSPDKKMARDTGDVIVNQDEKHLEAVTAYDRFELVQRDNIEGQWTVVVFANDKLIGKRVFQLKFTKNKSIQF